MCSAAARGNAGVLVLGRTPAGSTARLLLNGLLVRADTMVAQFRAITARHVGRPDLIELLARLNSSSAEFRTRWNQHEVRAIAPRVKQCRHPSTGRIDLEAVTTELIGTPDARLVAFTPADPVSAARLPLLLGRDRSREPVGAGGQQSPR